jgi:hypothetical protein
MRNAEKKVNQTMKSHVVVMEYEFELMDKSGRIQHGTVQAGETHTSAAWAAIAKAVKRPETGWLVRVRRIGNQSFRTRVFRIVRTGPYQTQLYRVETSHAK